MFRSSRKRATSNPNSNRPASASASLAATKAFIRDRESNGALSSAAAAAALRTHVTTPTPVAETVTKRMVRKGSVSSQGSARSGSLQPPGLRRQSSSGSMTERTFRQPSPSPSRGSPIDRNAPPIPAVPKNVPQVGVVHRRTSSLEPPARVGSPVGRVGGRGTSLDRGTSNASNRGRGQTRASPLSKVYEADDSEPEPRTSINFSRPMSPQLPSPTVTKPVASERGGQSGWFGGPVVHPEQSFRGAKPRPKTTDGLSAYATQQAQQAVQNAADRPVSTRASHMSNGIEGSRLATGSMRAKPSGTAVHAQPAQSIQPVQPVRPRIVDPKSPFAVYDPSSRKFIHKQDAMHLHRAMSDAEDPTPYEPPRAITPVHQEPQRYSQPPLPRQAIETREVVQRPVSESPVPEPEKKMSRAKQTEPAAAALVPNTATRGTATPQEKAPGTFIAQESAAADANTSRKLASPAPEVMGQEEQQSPKFAANQDSAYPRLAPRPVSMPSDPSSVRGSSISGRNHSQSPQRNAHFAAVAVEFPSGVRHQPPGRSVSPAKSALKPSPSVSRRSNSPLANDGRAPSRGAPSETSDVVSEDGMKRKKKVRISFEAEPTVVGVSAYADTDLLSSPTGPSAPRWDEIDQEEDLDEILKPRPVLPSFGSIRDKNRRARDEEMPEKVTETVSSSLSTLPAESTEVSSDHKIGGVLSQDFATKKVKTSPSGDPVPPEVTSVEGSGYYSDSDQSDSSDSQSGAIRSTLEPEPKTLTSPGERRPTAAVPVIAVQPASPFLHEEAATPPLTQPDTATSSPSIPGGWDEENVSTPATEAKQTTSGDSAAAPSQPTITIQIPDRIPEDDSSDDNSSVYSDAYEDLEEREGFGSIDAIMESPNVASPLASSTSSPTEARPAKAGLETSRWAPANTQSPPSPADSHKSKPGLEASRWSPTNTQFASEERDEVAKTQRTGQAKPDWEAAEQHWSEVNDSRKQKPQRGLESSRYAPVGESKGESPLSSGKQDKERKVRAAPAARPRPQALTPSPAKAAPQPRKSAMKKPANPTPAEIPLKKTMRDRAPAPITTEPHMRRTMRGADASLAGRGSPKPVAQRQSMPPMAPSSPKGALHKKYLPAAAAGSAAKPRPQSAFTAAPTYESDSDASVSSFQRERQRKRAPKNNSGAYTMRMSMRSGPTPTMRAPPAAVRPISPPMPSPQHTTLRKSMRPSSPTPESPGVLKSSRFSIRSLSPGGRFRRRSSADYMPPMPTIPVQAPPPKPVPVKKSMFSKPTSSKPPAKSSKPKFKSRITDSSDEEPDQQPRQFQSRFADSDSEDEDFELPPGLAPVRGIPRRPGEEDGDSTDLEDETSDNEAPPPPVTNGDSKSKIQTTNESTNVPGTTIAPESLGKQAAELPTFGTGKKKSKRGFFGLGKGKKKTSYLDEPGAEAQNLPSFDIPMPPQQRNSERDRPLTPIGEDKDTDAGQTKSQPPKAGRPTPTFERSVSDSWPLPQSPGAAEGKRPQTADGPAKRRPTLVKRNPSQISEAHTDIGPKSSKQIAFGQGGKKKKFKGLRRVFGLND